MFSMINSQLLSCLHVQHGLRPIVVLFTCSVWFTANICAAHISSMVHSQLLRYWRVLYDLQPSAALLAHMLSMVYTQLLWGWHVQYGLQPDAVVLTCSIWFIAHCSAANMFNVIYSQQSCCSHVQYGLQPIELLRCSNLQYGLQLIVFFVVLTYSVWFTAGCCGAGMFRGIYSQLLCWFHIQYGLQPIVVLLTCSTWFTASCCGAKKTIMVLTCSVWFTAICCGVDMFSVVNSQLLCCSHVPIDLQPLVVLPTCSVWFTANSCSTDMVSMVYSPLMWFSHIQYCLQLIDVVLICLAWFTANFVVLICSGLLTVICCAAEMFRLSANFRGVQNCSGAHIFSMVYSELFWCWHVQYNSQLLCCSHLHYDLVNCCAAHMFSMVCSQLLWCWHFQ